MIRIILSRQAKKDLDIIHDSPLYARRQVERMLHRIKQVKDPPSSVGQPVPELKQPQIREITEGSYRIIFRASEDLMEIITIMRAHRIPPNT